MEEFGHLVAAPTRGRDVGHQFLADYQHDLGEPGAESQHCVGGGCQKALRVAVSVGSSWSGALAATMVTALEPGRRPLDSAKEGQGLVSRSRRSRAVFPRECPKVLLSNFLGNGAVEVGLEQIDGPANGGVGPVAVAEGVDAAIHADAGGVGPLTITRLAMPLVDVLLAWKL